MSEHNKICIEKINSLAKANPTELISIAEASYESELNRVAEVVKSTQSCSILLTSGPSGSTKTTTSHKLARRLCGDDVHSVVVSLDDFFVDRSTLPKLENGDTDYESINTLDTETVRICFDELINKRQSYLPIFDFKTGKRSNEKNHIVMKDHTIVIVEGIHALNPFIVDGMKRENYLKLYISPHSDYYLGENEMVLSSRNTRLIRRMVRDYYYRGNSVQNTLLMWTNVVKSEVENIIPFRAHADLTIDSTIIYEPCLYSFYLKNVTQMGALSEEQSRCVLDLLSAVSKFEQLSPEIIPRDTVLWEFLK